MQVVRTVDVLDEGRSSYASDWALTQKEIIAAAKLIEWPNGTGKFSINPTKKGNGVKPIKKRFLQELENKNEWDTELQGRRLVLDLDAVRSIDGGSIGLEWETGNVSSTHRAVNRILLGILNKEIRGGFLILPSRKLYTFLTDRIGNFKEIEKYIDLWRRFDLEASFTIVVFEQDEDDPSAPLIPKGNDGMSKN